MKLSRIASVFLGLALVMGCEEDQATEATEATEAEELALEDETSSDKVTRAEEESNAAEEARDTMKKAAATLKQMKQDEALKKLLKQSRGVFIVPEYGRAAAGVGARGGEGVLLAHQDGKWSGPVFYDVGGISVGAQFGAEGGEIAMVLMSEQGLNSFKEDNTFSLNAGAELTFVDYSELSRAAAGRDVGDVVFWSGAEGAFAGVTLSASQISWDDEENPAYYGAQVATAEDILSGNVSGPDDTELQKALAAL